MIDMRMSGSVDERMACAGRIVIVMIGLLSVMTVRAQNAAQFVLWGDNAMTTDDFYGASRFYGEALQQEGGRMELQWKYAEACRLSNQYPQAAEAYEKVWRKDLGRSHPDGLRWLGEMQLCAGSYDEAQKTWQKVKQKTKDKSGFTKMRAHNALAGIALAKTMMAAPEEVTIEHLPEPVNTYDSEFGARIGPGTRLYFTTLRGEVNDNEEVVDTALYHASIWITEHEGGTWTAPAPMEPTSPGTSLANSAWSVDSSVFYYSHCPPGTPCHIFGKPLTGVASAVNGIGPEHTTQPMVALFHGKETLFFTSDMEGGQGGLDIWMASIHGTDAAQLSPLGSPINTPGNETCPYYDEDQQKLYFSSDFLPGLGGYDNFVSLDSAGTFTAPVNIGFPLNGPANDLYPTFDVKTMSGFFTSNRIGSLAKKGATCCNDIYRYSYPTLRRAQRDILVKDTLTVAEKRITSLREKLPIRLYFHNDEPNPRSQDTITTLTYEQTYRSYKALLPDYHKAWGDPGSGTAAAEGLAAIDGFFEDKVDHGFAQLNDFIRLLKQALEEGQRIELQVRGFASPLAKSDYNANLSLRRISSMVNYLRTVDHGALIAHFNSGALRVRKSPFGEGQSASGVSDQLEDLKGSVYSVGASLERRIEIEQVLLADENGANAQPVDSGLTCAIGTLFQGIEREKFVTVRNTTTRPLTLREAHIDCDCFTVQVPDQTIAPGAVADIRVLFTGRARPGSLTREVTIDTDGEPATLRLVITGVVVPH